MADIDQWPSFRPQLIQKGGPGFWRRAFRSYFRHRLESRYFRPIRLLKKHDAFKGEGFSIMTILCSLIEFLESTLQGENYRYISPNERRKGAKPGEFEYSDSLQMFVNFLCKRMPFAEKFDDDLAVEFYRSIRCGLLHEAQTKNGWRVLAKSMRGVLVDRPKRIVFRDDFHNAIGVFVQDYSQDLPNNAGLQAAFIRKFDYLACESLRRASDSRRASG